MVTSNVAALIEEAILGPVPHGQTHSSNTHYGHHRSRDRRPSATLGVGSSIWTEPTLPALARDRFSISSLTSL